jgi:hypothetical protein
VFSTNGSSLAAHNLVLQWLREAWKDARLIEPPPEPEEGQARLLVQLELKPLWLKTLQSAGLLREEAGRPVLVPEALAAGNPSAGHLAGARPRWSRQDRQLLANNEVVKELRVTATLQMDLLDALERGQWTSAVANPIRAGRRERSVRLREGVRGLNLGHRKRLLRFLVLDAGERLGWQYV